MRPGKLLLLFLILILLILPLCQSHFLLVREHQLKGYFNLKLPPSLKEFTWKRWFSGTFQEEMTSRTNDHIGFRNSFFRVNNEVDYRLFHLLHAQGFVEGKKGYLFEEDYIREYLGDYFVGPEILEPRLKKLRQVSSGLEKAGIPFVLVVEPGKASFFPEYIPDHYFAFGKRPSNYEYILKRSKELEIPVVDLNRYFLGLKDTSRYPLFPKYGMHWSIYGSVVAMDTLFRYVEAKTGASLPVMSITKIEVSDSMRWTDKDIGELLNLIFPLSGEWLAYPELAFDTATPKKISILVIADSYYINIIHNCSGQLFKDHTYWYYNSKVYPHIIDDRDPKYIDKTKMKKQLLSFDMVLLMVSEINMHCGFWNFADEAYLAFHPDDSDPSWYPYEKDILNNREWFRFMVTKAKDSHISTGKAIIRDAKYLDMCKNQ
ncbi:MAG: hypothetical protein JXA23_12150 [Bacteroidales bacterium]|nr:hypothetical protein [Bacteroidales bacterium]